MVLIVYCCLNGSSIKIDKMLHLYNIPVGKAGSGNRMWKQYITQCK